jgi:hypothetical protein
VVQIHPEGPFMIKKIEKIEKLISQLIVIVKLRHIVREIEKEKVFFMKNFRQKYWK